jgi:hypothetical protein
VGFIEKDNFSKPKELAHYTSIEVLNLILKNKSIKFNRLDLVDDMSESKTVEIENASKFIYVSCWSEADVDNLSLWNMYADNMHGVKIIMPFFPFIIEMDGKEYFIDEDDIPRKKQCELKGFDIIKNELYQLNPNVFSLEENEFINFYRSIDYKDSIDTKKVINRFPGWRGSYAYLSVAELGITKHKDWEFQKEFRYLLPYGNQNILLNILKGINPSELKNMLVNFNSLQESIYIPVHKKALDSCKIIIGPKCSESEIDLINYIIEKYNPGIECNYSKWYGLIKK